MRSAFRNADSPSDTPSSNHSMYFFGTHDSMMMVEHLTETIILVGPNGTVWQAPRGNLGIGYDRPTEVIFKRFDDARIEQSITGSFSELMPDTATTWSLMDTAWGLKKHHQAHASRDQPNLGQLSV
jgi:hypothetical protein